MVVRTVIKDHRVAGLLVGDDDVQRHFPKEITTIVLDLGHLHIQCQLSPEFWDDCPEIHDPRLSAWLESVHRNAGSDRAPVPLLMNPLGADTYLLRPISASERESEKEEEIDRGFEEDS